MGPAWANRIYSLLKYKIFEVFDTIMFGEQRRKK